MSYGFSNNLCCFENDEVLFNIFLSLTEAIVDPQYKMGVRSKSK